MSKNGKILICGSCIIAALLTLLSLKLFVNKDEPIVFGTAARMVKVCLGESVEFEQGSNVTLVEIDNENGKCKLKFQIDGKEIEETLSVDQKHDNEHYYGNFIDSMGPDYIVLMKIEPRNTVPRIMD